MKLAYVTTYDARSLKGSNEWSGTGYYIAQSAQCKRSGGNERIRVAGYKTA
jgi:hypothetical protein